MNELLNNLYCKELPRINAPGANYLRGSYLQNLQTIRNYYNAQRAWLPNEHLLVRIITGSTLSHETDDQRYYDLARLNNNQQVVRYQLCNAINPGVVRIGESSFYNKNISEIMIAVEEDINVPMAVKEWRRLEPVKVLVHPFDDLSLPLLDGNYPYALANDIAIFSINIPLLLLMYKCWFREIGSKQKDIVLKPHSFVRNFVLPTMCASHLDIARFNRLHKQFNGLPLSPYKQVHNMHITDYTQRNDDDGKYIIDYIKKTPLTYSQLLNIIPVSTRPNFSTVLRIPPMLINRQNQIPLFLTRLKVIDFLLTVNPDNNGYLNQNVKNEIIFLIREMENDSLMINAFPHTVHQLYARVKKLLLM